MEDKNGHKIDPKTGKLIFDPKCAICIKKQSFPEPELSHDL